MQIRNRMKVTKKSIIGKVLEEKPEAAEKFFEAGMACVGCPMSSGESIEQGCKAHGLSDKEINGLVEELNKK